MNLDADYREARRLKTTNGGWTTRYYPKGEGRYPTDRSHFYLNNEETR